MKFNLQPGKSYKVVNTKFTNTEGMICADSVHEFKEAVPCYDVNFHGVTSNPDNYIAYIFKLPKQFGIVTFYQFQITEAIPV